MIAAALLACAVNVAPVTLEAVIQVESGGNPLAVNVNRLAGPQPHPATPTEAAAVARRYIAEGYSVDLGLMQVNSRNLPALGYSIDQVLDPCTSIKAGAAILTANYADAVRSRGEGQAALHAALSAYNTGSFFRGFANGYVARYFRRSAVPALAGVMPTMASGVRDAATVPVAAVARPAPPPSPYTADTQVFVREASNVRIQ